MVLLKRDLPTGKASPGLWGGLTHLFITKSLPLNLQLRDSEASKIAKQFWREADWR